MESFHPDFVEYEENCTTYGAFFNADGPAAPENLRDVLRYGDVEECGNAVNLFSMVGKHDGTRAKEDPNARGHFVKSFVMQAVSGCTKLQVY